MAIDRRRFLIAPLALAATVTRGEVVYPQVTAGTALAFPRDHGAHPEFRTEWWYITGWVDDGDGRDFGIQITFFRTRPGVAEDGGSRFTPTQLLFAHAAVADPRAGKLRHDQRAARSGMGLAEAALETTDVRIGDWSLQLAGQKYTANVAARDFAFALTFSARQPILLQGERGFSRKGPRAEQASFYYSRPQLTAAGALTLDDRTLRVNGGAWLDHEWSSAFLAPGTQGWDWIGINFDDGGALMAFRIRANDGSVHGSGGTLRTASGSVRTFEPAAIRFTALRYWRSPRTGIVYPVAFRIEAGSLALALEPLFDDQELDSRASVGTVYWEGAVRALEHGRPIGRGYLELTGYGGALKI
ncbi:MAG: carotenoid 1,2-hydratase [Burkholderiales bacterium]|nr:carotenoid 1,2-hydratase [Burkholderiales bacterium]